MTITTTKKVLICDDEEGIRESLKLILSDFYNLTVTTSGQQCLEMIDKDPTIGIVLIDIKMPRVSGLDILKEIKKKRKDLNVVMVTGYKSVETAAEATKAGASGYIVKPFKADDILDTVKRNLK